MTAVIHPSAAMKPQLMRLWNSCFEHDGDFCDFFFDRCFEPGRALAVTDDSGGGEVRAALHFLDSRVRTGGRSVRKAWYVYGVATAPSHRRKGYATLLLRRLTEEARKNGIAALYLTAETEAWHLYESVGFFRAAELSRTVMEVAPGRTETEWLSCPPEKFMELRTAYTGGLEETFLWDGRELEFMYRDACRDGRVLCTNPDGREYYAVVRLRDGELTVTETDFPRERGEQLAQSVAACFHWKDPVILYGRKDEFFSGSSVLSRDNFYIGHILPTDGTFPPQGMYMNLLAD